MSRGSGSYLDDQSHKSLVENTIDIVQKNIPNYNFLIKKHPREFNSYWDNFLNDDSINIVNDHILNLATQADLAISFWTSGAMDCHTLGVPVIEYFDPNQHPKQQVQEGNSLLIKSEYLNDLLEDALDIDINSILLISYA